MYGRVLENDKKRRDFSKCSASEGSEPEKCKDTKAYIKEAAPKVMILGIVVTLWGICDLACTSLGVDNMAIFWGTFVIVMVVLVWFGITTGKLRKKYFS